MVNVLIKDNNIFFRWGMENYLVELFLNEFNKQVDFSLDFNHDSVAQADVIVMEFCKGEAYTCTPELKSRAKGVIIGIVDDDFKEMSSLTQCITGIIFVQRCMPLKEMRQKIVNQWSIYKQAGEKTHCSNCLFCPRLELTPRQVKVMAGIYKGKTMHRIAGELNVSSKTVSSHKYVVMNKFNLSNDYDLLKFLNRLKDKNIQRNYFREFLIR